MTTTQRYPSDLTDDEWAIIAPLLPRAKPGGRPRTVDRRAVLNAIFYILRSGCQWRMLPRGFPPWGTVASYFSRWRTSGAWERINDTLRTRVRLEEAPSGEATPSAAILDSQSVKTTEAGGERGYDAGKQVNGRKRHLVVDTLGLLLAVVVHGADVQDYDGARLVLAEVHGRFPRLKKIWADSRYACNGLPDWVKKVFGWVVEVVRRPVGAIGFVVLHRRWVVERTFAWLGRNRRLSKDYERSPRVSEAWIRLAMIRVMLRRLAAA